MISDDSMAIDTIRTAMAPHGFDVAAQSAGARAATVAAALTADVALVDLSLSDADGPEVLRMLRSSVVHVPCIVMAAAGTFDAAVEVMRLGACDYIEKRILALHVKDAIERAIAECTSMTVPEGFEIQAHALDRWADAVITVINSPKDPRTLRDWARTAAASIGALRNWCRTARIPARRSLSFARALRAVLLQQAIAAPAEHLLNIVDRRTLAKLLTAAGGTADQLPPTVDDLLERQRLVTEPGAMAAIRSALKRTAASQRMVRTDIRRPGTVDMGLAADRGRSIAARA